MFEQLITVRNFIWKKTETEEFTLIFAHSFLFPIDHCEL